MMSLFMSCYREKRNEWLGSIKECSFPTLIRGCRHAMGISRERIAEFLKVPEHKLKRVELGLYKTSLEADFLRSLQALYDIPSEMFYKAYHLWLDHQEETRNWK